VSAEGDQKGRFGRLYKGHEGQYGWLLHRVTGVAIILFLFAHVVDTAVVGWGPDAYNRVASVYHNPFIRLLELGLVAAVLYHSFNGVRIMLIDFFPGLTRYMRALGLATTLLFIGAMIPITWIMGSRIVELLVEG
jgi:succinate dehydrogenase / fumarate reductase, cytochrome b subunit